MNDGNAQSGEGEKKQSASDFIRGLPSDMSVGEVLERGKAAGLEFSLDLVRKVRQRMNQRGKAGGRKPGRPSKGAERATVKAAAKPGPKGKRGRKAATGAAPVRAAKGGEKARPTESKAAFILSFPNDTPAQEIVAEAKSQGIKFSANYVYYVRGAGQRRKKVVAEGRPAAPAAKAAKAAKAAAGPSARGGGGGSHDEAEFFDLVVRVGLTRAEQLLGQVRERLRAMVGGG